LSIFSASGPPVGPDVPGPDVPPPMAVVDMVWPDQSNHHGTLFGGAALSMLDRVAFILGSRTLRGAVVTAAVSRLDFAAPALSGQLVECRSQVVRRGRRSVTLAATLVAETLLSGKRTTCLSGEFVMVRQMDRDAQGPTPGTLSRESLEALPEITPEDVSTVAEIVFPGHVNHRGVLHGGPAMAWMAKAGFVAATRQARRTVVMAASDELNFKRPAHVGDVVEVSARVVAQGKRSLQVRVDMWAECPSTGLRRHCSEARLVYVAVDA
jgi:acyl-CoA hydrolase